MAESKAFPFAREAFARAGVDCESAITTLGRIPISLHCWQGDDVGGFENRGASLDGGLAVTGNHPGKAGTPDELRADLDAAFALIPGRHRLNLHAMYGEFGNRRVERDAIGVEHFRAWIDWAKARKLGLDFNPTFFAHPRAAGGWTLAHPDRSIRRFWIEHGRRSREIAAAFGRALGSPSVNNVWIPDGSKDTPADRRKPRERLAESLDAIFERRFAKSLLLDSVEPKLFGLGSESFVAGSHDFYLAYALERKIMLCLDTGHYHPTEDVADKISSLLQFMPRLLIHVSRGVRWDSDHVVVLNDPLLALAREVISGGFLGRVRFGLDYFDASIHRVSAWVIGARNLLKALLIALLEPASRLRGAEESGDLTGRLFWQEAARTLPWAMVWDEYCRRFDVPGDRDWIAKARAYERDVLPRRA